MSTYNTKQKYNLVKYCNECDCKLTIGINWTKGRQRTNNYICNNCNNKYKNNWKINNSEKVNESKDKFRRNNPNYKSDWNIANYDKVKASHDKYNKNHPDHDYNQWLREHPEERRACGRKSQAKRRGYDYIELFANPFPPEIPVVGHHISDAFVFYIPTELHLKHLHGSKKQLHRDELKQYVEDIYNITYIIEDIIKKKKT